MREPLLELHRVSLLDGDLPILTEVSLTLYEQEILGVVFQQGIGKTALLHIAAGLLAPTKGEVVLRGRRLAALQGPDRPPLGFVFAEGGLMENLSLYENVALPLRYHTNLDEDAIESKVLEHLQLVGMEEQRERFPWQLTRDRCRLAALARALVVEPVVVFVDDFFLGADADAFRRMEQAVGLARDAVGTSFFLVLEATPDDFGCADRLCLVDHGAVLELDRPE